MCSRQTCRGCVILFVNTDKNLFEILPKRILAALKIKGGLRLYWQCVPKKSGWWIYQTLDWSPWILIKSLQKMLKDVLWKMYDPCIPMHFSGSISITLNCYQGNSWEFKCFTWLKVLKISWITFLMSCLITKTKPGVKIIKWQIIPILLLLIIHNFSSQQFEGKTL